MNPFTGQGLELATPHTWQCWDPWVQLQYLVVTDCIKVTRRLRDYDGDA